MAIWCTAHAQTPDTWLKLTRLERLEFDNVLREVTNRA